MPETSGEPKTEVALIHNSARELSSGITGTELQVDTASSPRNGRSGNVSLTTMERWPVAAFMLLVAGWGGSTPWVVLLPDGLDRDTASMMRLNPFRSAHG